MRGVRKNQWYWEKRKRGGFEREVDDLRALANKKVEGAGAGIFDPPQQLKLTHREFQVLVDLIQEAGG
jgi:hypothetical protein